MSLREDVKEILHETLIDEEYSELLDFVAGRICEACQSWYVENIGIAVAGAINAILGENDNADNRED